jgi:predicted transport protein
MTDIKLFRTVDGVVAELAAQSPQVEKSLQALFERNLEPLLGVRFLATEYSTGPVQGGRIDTLGIDEDGTPVIIEYKRSINENVINQGLFYLDWLMDHRKEFQWLVMENLGKEVANKVEWTSPRLICVAGDFTRYDSHAVKQINRSIELIRYRRFAEEHLVIELVHAPNASLRMPPAAGSAPQAPAVGIAAGGVARDPYLSQKIDYRLSNSPPDLKDVWEAAVTFLTALGDDVQVKELKHYVAFKRIKNFVCLEIYPQARVVIAYAKVNPDKVMLKPGFVRDVRKVGHFGTGDLEISMRTMEDMARATPLLQLAYEGG